VAIKRLIPHFLQHKRYLSRDSLLGLFFRQSFSQIFLTTNKGGIMKDYSVLEALTFNDISLVPCYSEVLPNEVDVSIHLGKNLHLNSPILSAAMDTVTTAPMAIAMAQVGGLGIIHKNCSPKQQALEVLQVKKYQSEIMENSIYTHDSQGQLACGAALGCGPDFEERAYDLMAAGVDTLVVDSAHGHSKNVFDAIRQLRLWFKDLLIIAGNVVTKEGAIFLHEAGADVIKIGIGPGSICTTRVVAGVGIPHITAILNVAAVAREKGFTVIADGGLQYSGDITKALAAGSHAVMTGALLAGTIEAPGERIVFGGREFKVYRGMGSILAMNDGSKDRYGQSLVKEASKLVPEGIEGRLPCRGSAKDTIFQLMGGLKAGMGYVGAKNIAELHEKAKFVRVSSAGLRESHVHDVIITNEAPNYFSSMG
jgi:IMP dehydrogenase